MRKEARITSKQTTVPREVRRMLGEISAAGAFSPTFLIGAHAEVRGHRLLALDERLYRAAFPALTIETI